MCLCKMVEKIGDCASGLSKRDTALGVDVAVFVDKEVATLLLNFVKELCNS